MTAFDGDSTLPLKSQHCLSPRLSTVRLEESVCATSVCDQSVQSWASSGLLSYHFETNKRTRNRKIQKLFRMYGCFLCIL